MIQKQQVDILVKCKGCSERSVQDIDNFLKYLLEQKSEITAKSYIYDLIAFTKWFERVQNEDLEISKVTSEILNSYQVFLSESEKLKPHSINRKFSAIRSFLQWSARANLLPDKRIPQFPQQIYEPQQEQPYLSQRELNQLLQVVEQSGNLRDTAIILLLATTGLRVSELCALTWEDVDLNGQVAWLSVRGRKNDQIRKLPITETTRKALVAYHSQASFSKQESIFLGKKGPMTSRGIQILLKKYAQKANLPHVTPHILRHTCILQLLESALPVETIAYFLGHKSSETIHRYYKISNDEIQENMENILRSLAL